jgi:hypothetical protein
MIGNLSENRIEEINNSLPQLPYDWFNITRPEQNSFALNDLLKSETTHLALVCLHDAFRRTESALDCLFEANANVIWYREENKDIEEKHREFVAVLKGKFYVEYNFMFLYAIGEDVADFILNFLAKKEEFNYWQKEAVVQKDLETKNITSKAAKVGVFMADKYPIHEITKSILKLRDNISWKKAMRYRNTWVHQKPPIVEGLGIQFNRNSKIIESDEAIGFGFSKGSTPDYTIDEIIILAQKATAKCIEVLSDLLDCLREKRLEFETSEQQIYN